MDVRRVPGIPRAKSFGGSELTTTMQKLPPVRMAVANFHPVEMVDIEGDTVVVERLSAM